MKTYLRHRIANVIDVKELIALEYLDFDGKYKDYCESHEFWELCYVTDGQACLHIGGKDMPLGHGDIALIAPEVVHSYTKASENPKVFVVCFESMSQLLKPLARGTFETDARQKHCLDAIICDSLRTFKANESEQLEVIESAVFGGGQMIITQLEYLLIYTLDRLHAKEGTKIVFFDSEDFYESITETITEYLNKNINKSITLDQICAKVNYSSSFICRTFKKQTGQTVFEYFNAIKIERAKQLLSETKEPILSIAYELGFSGSKYFNTIFKKLTGVTPSEYRKENIR